MKLQEYFLCEKNTKMTTLFNNSSLLCHTCAAPCLEIIYYSLYFCFLLCTKSLLTASYFSGWTTDVTWTILTMSLLRFWFLNMVVSLLSMQGQKALGFHQRYLNLCSQDERRSYEFGTTWGWVINDRIFKTGIYRSVFECFKQNSKYIAVNVLLLNPFTEKKKKIG